MHQKLANATFRIECNSSSGSGFSFCDEQTIITNFHVIESHFNTGAPIYAFTEEGQRLRVNLRSYSDKTKYDFAILDLIDPLPEGRFVLQPEEGSDLYRGRRVIFAGYPHGIHHLLVHEAIISGPYNDYAFYIDGAVNGGNSGGPIIGVDNGKVIGIITQRRFLGGDLLNELSKPITELSLHCKEIANNGSVSIMGVDFGQFANLMSNSLAAITKSLEANSNTGIGIGFKIDFVHQECITPQSVAQKIIPAFTGRNSICSCGSGKRLKECCGKLV